MKIVRIPLASRPRRNMHPENVLVFELTLTSLSFIFTTQHPVEWELLVDDRNSAGIRSFEAWKQVENVIRLPMKKRRRIASFWVSGRLQAAIVNR